MAQASRTGASPTRTRNTRGKGGLLREDIVAAGARLLSGGGETALTIRAVTREAGIAPQSFYLQFSSISELLFALYSAGHAQLHDRLAGAARSTDDPATRLRAIARAYLEFALAEPDLYRTLMESAGQVHPEWNPDDLPGTRSFDLLRSTVAAARFDLAGDERRLFVCTTMLWTRLHGVASLRNNRPTFPWPDSDALLDAIVTEVVLSH